MLSCASSFLQIPINLCNRPIALQAPCLRTCTPLERMQVCPRYPVLLPRSLKRISLGN
nr:MAG TPA: hypothetical protein [Caudoviricetes sp.]